MPSHYWGDEDFDWKNFATAICYCMDFWLKYGRIGSHGKEKYGTFRDHPYFFDGTLQSLIWPGYCRLMGSSWFYWNIDYKIIKNICKYTGIRCLVRKYQAFIYNLAIQRMCKKYPHLTDELVEDLDGYKMIKPGIFGKVDGTAIHNKYWTTYEKE